MENRLIMLPKPVLVSDEYIEKRLDEVVLNDILLTDKSVERRVGYINPCLNKTWYSMSLSGGEKLEQVFGHNHQTVMVKKC